MKSRNIRVFISSTFRDMNEERDYLNGIIFPQVRQYCEKRFLRFTPIDLRWGIPEEDSRNGLVLSTCIEEVDNSRPFFIGILGHRYGWTPSTNELNSLRADVQHLRPWLESKVYDGASITEMEIEYGVLRDMDIPYASFFLRGDDVSVPNEFHEVEGSVAESRLERLKARIRNQQKYPVTEYHTIEQFGEIIRQQLLDMIDAEYPPAANEGDDALVQRQEYILERRSQVLCDITEVERAFNEWLATDTPVLLIQGEPGTGTSTSLAYSITRIREAFCGRIIYFDFESVKRGEKPMDAMVSFLELKQNQIDDGSNAIIAIDNAEILSDEEIGDLSSWLKSITNTHTRIVIAASSTTMLEPILSYDMKCPSIRIEGLSKEKRREFVVNYMRQYGKRLTDGQIESILNYNTPNITTLKLVLYAIVNHGNFEDLDTYVTGLTKNSFYNYQFAMLLKEGRSVFASISQRLVAMYMLSLTTIAVASSGIPESDLLSILDITPTEWAVLRPNILQFCKGYEDRWSLADGRWCSDVVGYDDWMTMSLSLIKWYTAHPETWTYAAKSMCYTFYYMVIPPFFDQNLPNVQADRPYLKDVLDEMFAFVKSPKMVSQLSNNEYAGLWSRVPLCYKKMSDTPTMVYGRGPEDLSEEEGVEFYKRMAEVAMGQSRCVDASWCYSQIAQIRERNGHKDSIIYQAKSALLVGQARKAIAIIDNSGLLVKNTHSFLSRKPSSPIKLSPEHFIALSVAWDAMCAMGEWKSAKSITQSLVDDFQFYLESIADADEWADSDNLGLSIDKGVETIAKVAYAKSGFVPQMEDKKEAMQLLELLNGTAGSTYSICHPVSYLLTMTRVALSYLEIKNTKLSEERKQRIHGLGYWAQMAAFIGYGRSSYQFARAHLMFIYIHYYCTHNYGSWARRLHDYVERDSSGRALNHTDEYFYGAAEYGRYLESESMKNIEWNIVDKEVKETLLSEYRFFWLYEYEIQPDFRQKALKKKLDDYQISIHCLPS